jgi:hypothetical protein
MTASGGVQLSEWESRDSKSVAPSWPATGAQGFAKYFQRIAWILQIFPRIALAIL